MTESLQPDRIGSVDDLVTAARTEPDALGQLFDLFYPPVLAYCLRRLLVRAVAEDVTSEIFLKAATHITGFPGTCVEDFRRWIFRIATNEINAELRKSIRRRELLKAAAEMGVINTDVSAAVLGSDTPTDWGEVYQALNELSNREQSILSLRFFAGLKHDQIAEALELKAGTVRVAMARALDKLRDRLRQGQASQRAAPGTTGRGH